MRNKIAALAVVALSLSACNATEIYGEVKEANNNTFAAAMMRICGPTAFLPASRQLTPDEQADRLTLCAKYDARTLLERNEP
jgi:hypothetical protein